MVCKDLKVGEETLLGRQHRRGHALLGGLVEIGAVTSKEREARKLFSLNGDEYRSLPEGIGRIQVHGAASEKFETGHVSPCDGRQNGCGAICSGRIQAGTVNDQHLEAAKAAAPCCSCRQRVAISRARRVDNP